MTPVVRAASDAWRDRRVTGSQVAPAFAAWIAAEAYKGRTEWCEERQP